MKPFKAHANMDEMTLRDLHAMGKEEKMLGVFNSPLCQAWVREHQKTAAWQQTLERYGLK